MVVILLLPPYSTNGCDGRSNESSSTATSTTSTGETAIQTNDYDQQNQRETIKNNDKLFEDYNNNNQQTSSYYYAAPPPEPPAEYFLYAENASFALPENTSHYNKYTSVSPPPPPLPKSQPPIYVAGRKQEELQFYHNNTQNFETPSNAQTCANIVPKPPRYRSQSQPTLATIPEHAVQQQPAKHTLPLPPPPPNTIRASNTNAGECTPTTPSFHKANGNYLLPSTKTKSKSKSSKNSNYVTNTTNYVRHVTRVNFYDIDTSQVEYESKDYDGDDTDNLTLDDENNTEALTKEEEWVTKRKTELTTTRQIETHVKRQVVFEDGKVIEDSGPIVSTNTTEDTDKQETETTEKRDLGLPVVSNPSDIKYKGALQYGKETAAAAADGEGDGGELAELKNAGGTLVKSIVPRPADGLVREINEKRVVSHEETKDYFETEDVKHMGDFSDEAFVSAVNSGVENIEEVLLSPEYQKQLVPRGPRIIADKTKSFKTIDSEDIQKRSLAQEDGKIITESKKTTEHEVIVDDELPDHKSVGSAEQIKTQEVNQRYFKQRDEQHVDIIQDGKVLGTEMKYAAETMHMENDDMLERPGDWDSLSDRMRKMRKPHNKSIMQHPKGVVLMDRKDALTKRPLDFDKEEETRKGETIKWLESHFGSESTASNDSREDEVDVIEPTKKTYFNVTIKSNQNHTNSNTHYENNDKKTFAKRGTVDPLPPPNNGAKYYQGISNWNNRNEPITTTTPANHFASKAFRDDLHASIERNQLKKTSAVYSKKDNYISDTKPYIKPVTSESYVSREDIMQQKRQSLSSQFLARSRQNSRDHLDDLDKAGPGSFEESRFVSGSRTDLHYGMNVKDKEKRNYRRAELIDDVDSPVPPRKNSYVEERAKSYERSYVENARYNSLRRESQQHDSPSPHREIPTLERPTVPQRKRNGEKKTRQHSEVLSESKIPLQQVPIDVAEPPPDYSPPPRSRSSSPRESYNHPGLRPKSYVHSQQQIYTTSTVTEQQPREAQTLNRKQNQRTRFARNTPSPPVAMSQHQTLRPSMLTQTTQTTPSTISTSTVASHRSSKVGQAIGNSLRKLVGKLRSASVERKLRMKSKSKSREHSPAPATHQEQQNQRTYQQYNVIDSHIGGNHHTTSHDESEEEYNNQPKNQYTPGPEIQTKAAEHSGYNNATIDRRTLLHPSPSHPTGNNRDNGYRVMNPKHRYYLGEDPYSSSLYGKENVHDTIKVRNGIPPPSSTYSNRENSTSSHTLGRYQKSNQRFSGSTPNLNQAYRSTQTLPRKLNDQPSVHHYETQTVNMARSNATNKVQTKLRQQHQAPAEQRISYQPISQNTGPLKPARTYAKSLNRSKSFSVHAMNGSNDPSPIYMEKLTSNNYTNNNSLHSSQAYKSNPHIYSGSKENTLQQSALKSPSIVNLISRSQKDLTKIGTNEDDTDHYTDRPMYSVNNRHSVAKPQHYDDRKITPAFRSGSYIEDDYKYRPAQHYPLQQKHSLESRGSVEINKDTASIIRHEEYLRQKRNPPSGSTIIKVRNMDYRK